MHDSRLNKLADVLVRYSTAVKPGDLVSIGSDPLGMPLVEALYEAVLRAGGHPHYLARAESLEEIYVRTASPEQLAHVSPFDLYRVEKIDVHIGLWAEANTKYLGKVDPARTAAWQSARKPISKTFMSRAAAGKLRWVGTQFPTQGSAQDAEMSLRDYEEFVFRAGLLHLPDPVAAWQAIRDRQQRVCDFLQGRRTLHFLAPARDGHDGTDLTVDVSAGTWINCAGRENFPDGEVFTGPGAVNGHVNYTYPAVYMGREVEGVRLAFKDGRVVEAAARKNEAFLFSMLDQDAGARTLGEIAIGTNYGIQGFSRNTLFDEKIGGTFHAAVGAGYPESGNHNESGLHWDMVCDLRQGGSISVDGTVFHRDGCFVDPLFPQPE